LFYKRLIYPDITRVFQGKATSFPVSKIKIPISNSCGIKFICITLMAACSNIVRIKIITSTDVLEWFINLLVLANIGDERQNR